MRSRAAPIAASASGDASATPGDLEPVPHRGTFSVLRHRDFAVFWSSALVSNAGTWMQTITVPYVLDQLTHSTAVVGIGAFLFFFPTAIMGPIGGSFADRYSRRSVLLWSQGVTMLAAFAMWALWTSGVATPVNLLVCVGIGALATGITQPAWFAFITQLVPRDDMIDAIRLNSVQNQVARAIGPGLAGLVLATLGPGVAFLFNGLSFVIVLIGLWMIAPRPVGDAAPAAKALAHFVEAIRYVRERRVLATLVITIMMLMLLGQSMIQLIEPFTRRVLHVGPGQYGILVTAYGIGSIAGSFLTVHAERLTRSRMILIGAATFISAEIVFALVTNYAVALGMMTIFGAAFSVCVVTVQTSMQTNVHDSHRGRVISIYITAGYLGVPLGALIGGFVGDSIGLQAAFVGAALAMAAYIAYGALRFDRFRLFDQSLDDTEQIRSDAQV